jgi:two-component system, cell cycle sensor histidine kinase and response regulator CckA
VSTIERILVLAILGGIFLLDSVSPLGFSTWLLYLLPTLYISSRAGKPETIFYTSLISALVIIVFFISPPGLRPLLAATNRAFLITALWALSYLNFRRREIEKKLIAANETIRESEGTLRTIFDNSNDAILVHAPDGKIINANRRMLEMYQLEYRNALSLSVSDLSFSDNPLDSVPAIWGRVIDGENQLLEWKARRPKDHSVFDVEVYLTRIRYRGETAILATMRDISERKRIEEELQKAQRLDSIGLLAGGIAHDFNNILTAIQGNIELAGMYLPADNRAAARLAVAGKALIRARTLSQQLLTFAKGGDPITRTMEVSSLVREPVENSLRGSKAEVAYSIAEDLPPVEADETQIGQAIGNLAANAVESMPEGGVLIVTAGKEYLPLENTLGLPTGEYVRIDIKDQGAGIPPELREKIFDPYFTTKEQGSGLGLAIAYSIIKKHGGTIRVDSAPGEGSTFSIFLPVSHMARSPQSMGENAKVLQPG